MFRRYSVKDITVLLALTISILIMGAAPASAQTTRYHRTNLVSDVPGVALRTDPNLVNPWGIAFSAGSPPWIADNGTGLSTLYQADGQPFPVASPLVVTIPPPAGASGPSAPTGIVVNGTTGFVVSGGSGSGASAFIFDTEDGTISGWSPAANPKQAILVVDNSKPGGVDNSSLGAVYKGLAIAENGTATFIYATNFRDGFVEQYDSNFKFVKKFTDPNLPEGFAPFGIQAMQGNLFVTFAKQDAAKHDDVAGARNGYVDIFDTNGNLLKRFASAGSLNSPWGLVQAPQNFGEFSGDVLVGNFGDGRINVFDAKTGFYQGYMKDDVGAALTINSLWGLAFGTGAPLSGHANRLLFTAGIGAESHGLFGDIRVTTPQDLPLEIE
ncbi:MAG: TIGR03118 family protein [Candidatus Acidiferrales bacterium]